MMFRPQCFSLLVLFLTLTNCCALWTTEEQATIRQAASLLASIGVTDLCSPYLGNLMYFPKCGDGVSSSLVQQDHVESFQRQRHLDEVKDNNNNNSANSASTESSLDFIIDCIGTTLCIVCAALASGLTIGMLSLDPLVLLMKSRAATDEKERREAESILPLIQQRHLLLVTLLLLNTAAGEALPVFLQGIFPEVVAVCFAIILVLVFGEILPSALFTSSNQMKMVAHCSSLVRILMVVLYPVAYPISKCLDYLVHSTEDGPSAFNRNELSALIRIQYERRQAVKERRRQFIRDSPSETTLHELPENGSGAPPVCDWRLRLVRRYSSDIHTDEVTMIQGALQMKTKCAVDRLCSHLKVFSISSNTILDEATICKIYSSGYSRVPVYYGTQKTCIIGILMTRQLILVNDTDNCPVSRLPLYVPHCIAPDTNLLDLVNLFQEGGKNGRVGHMALVYVRPDLAEAALASDELVPEEAGWMGILTMEDCIEALLQEPIFDEMDAAGRWRASMDIEEMEVAEGDYHRMA